jgi:hypothetical protein
LLAIIPPLLDKAHYASLTRSVVAGVLLMALGLVFAVIHNRHRRKCSLIYEQHDMRPPPGTLFGFKLSQPRDCAISDWFRWASLTAFIVAILVVSITGLCVIK